MSQTAITLAFEQWKAQQAATGEAVLLDEFVFASVPGLDPAAPVDRSETMPPADQIVYRQPVTRKGVVNSNAVVHSVVLGADVGDFTFNWIGLINKATGTLAMIVHAPDQQKLKTKEGQQGNVLTRSFLMEYNGARTETGITTPAETWQVDFTARMAGMDGRQRLENVDIYGAAAFFGDGWLVNKSGNQFFVTNGVGYVAGLRSELTASQNINVTTKPVKVWLDVCWTGSLLSVWGVQSKITVATELADYTLDGVKHYVFALASIDTNGAITDLRPKGSLDQQQGSKDFLRKEANLADVSNVAEARKSLKLGSAALADVQTSRNDTTAGRLLTTGSVIAVRSFVASGTAGADASDVNAAPKNAVSFAYASANNSPGFECSILDYAGLNDDYSTQLAASYSRPGLFKFRTRNGDNGNWSTWHTLYSTGNKPTPADVGAVPSAGGTVQYLADARYYNAKIGYWQGAGAFAQQYSNGTAPFCVPSGYATPKDVSQYLPICKGVSQTEYHGYGSSISFGILRSGKADFGSAAVHMIGDNGSAYLWTFDATGNFNSPGAVVPGNYGNFDGRYIMRDSVSYVGLVSNNPADPYMRRASTNELVYLATKNDVNSKAAPNTAGWSGALMWWRCGSTGAMRMSATIGGVPNGGRVTFPQAFPNVCAAVIPTRNEEPGNGAAMQAYNVDRTGFNLRVAGGGTVTIMYEAEGY